jgi:PAS domain S-box-containing protein
VLTYVSPQSRQFLDCEPEEALVPWQEFLTDNPENEISLLMKELAIRTRQRQPAYELELKTRKGRKLSVKVHESPVVEEGRTTAIVGVLTDITDRKRAAHQFHDLFEMAPEATLMVNSEGIIILANRQVEAIFGWKPRELIGKAIEVLVPPDSREGHLRVREGYFAAAAPQHVGTNRPRLRGLRKDGTIFPAEISMGPVETVHGQMVIATVRDVSDRVNSEINMKRQQRIAMLRADVHEAFNRASSLDSTLQSVTDAVLTHLGGTLVRLWLLDEAGGTLVLKASAVASKQPDSMFGLRAIPVGKLKCGKIAASRLPLHTNDISGDPDIQEKGFLAAIGSTAFAGHPLVLNGVLLGVLALFAREALDPETLEALGSVAVLLASRIAQRQAEQELQALNADLEERIRQRTEELTGAKDAAEAAHRAKSTFLATMSHEIRTPMNAVLGMAELLEESVQNPEHKAMLETLRVASESLLAIINDILDFSKIEAGRLEIVKEDGSIASIVSSVYSLFLPRAREKRLTLQVETDKETRTPVLLDPVRVRQIVLNLVSNAIKFTEAGCITLRARMIDSNDRTLKARIDVTDTGKGMSREQMAILFKPFVQVQHDGNHRAQGTGLGLAISRQLAELLGGTLEIESEPGAGTTATLCITVERTTPLTLQSQVISRVEAGSESNQADTISTGDEPRVLVVDDNPLNLDVLMRQLRRLGYSADTASGGLAALHLLKRRKYAVILNDCQMPGMDGYQLAQEIRKLEQSSGKPAIPIIACSANTQSDEIERCIAAGMNDYLLKPVTLDALKKKLASWGAGNRKSAQDIEAKAAPPSAAEVDDSSGVIDPQVLDEITGGSDDMAISLLRDFAEQQEVQFRSLRQAFSANDLAGIAHAAHRLKGAVRTIGAGPLGDVCDRIERAAKSTDRMLLRELRQAYAREVDRLRDYLSDVARPR